MRRLQEGRSKRRYRYPVVACALVGAIAAHAQPLSKTAIQVGSGNTVLAGQAFAFRLDYTCASVSGPCLNAQVIDLLPEAVQLISTVPSAPVGDIATINITPNFQGSGRTRVLFVLNNPLPAGNGATLLVNVRFPAGSVQGTAAMNVADAVNLAQVPGTYTTPAVTVTVVDDRVFADGFDAAPASANAL